MRVEDSLGLVGVGLRRGSTCQRDVATHTLHGAAVRCTQSTCSLLGRLGVRVVGDEQVKLRLSERLSDPAADAARAAGDDDVLSFEPHVSMRARLARCPSTALAVMAP